MDTCGRYFHDGFTRIPFDVPKLFGAVERALAIPEDSDFEWRTKYPHTRDFRESAPEFDSTFIDVLFDSGVPDLLEEMTNSNDLTLIHCQLRHVGGVNSSYMDWHRDTYLDRNQEWVGNTPPVQKVMVYPTHGRDPEDRLHIVPTSHRRMFDQPDMDVTAFNHLNMMGAAGTIRSSDEHALVFNTALLHSVVPESHVDGSTRVIYSFATRRQFLNGYNHGVHIEMNRMYEERKNG